MLVIEAGAKAIVGGDKDLLDHPDLEPPAIDARSTCQLVGLLDPPTRGRTCSTAKSSRRVDRWDREGERCPLPGEGSGLNVAWLTAAVSGGGGGP